MPSFVLAVALPALLLAACATAGGGGADNATVVPDWFRSATPAAATTGTQVDGGEASCEVLERGGQEPDIPTIGVDVLEACHPEALETLELVREGGPFPYGQDDETFQNREGYLPAAAGDSYREYTVETPGEDDRGARRIVTFGEPGRESPDYERLYYTADHYDSFFLVVE